MLALRDPIHVYVRADDLEAAVLATRPLQRLRWVRQLGLAQLVFPGAEHSRFSHALGAMELAGRVYDALAEKAPDLLDADRRSPERRRVRLAALVHDVGHAPFSHSAEELFEDGLSHEDMTIRLLHTPEVEAAIDRAGIDGVDAASVERILTGRGAEIEPLLAQIVSGELDVDKMDYLLRDSLYCGVRYGNYDLGRLLETITPLRDPATLDWGIGIDEGGVHALEALVLARYYMFTQVYFNVTGKVLELHLNEWLAGEGIRWPADASRFLEHDDLGVWAAMRRSTSHHARAIVERDHYALAFETREHTTAAERESFLALVEEARARFEPGDLLVSNSAKDPHRLGEVTVLVRDRDGALEKMQDVSHFIRHLTRIERFRVYARPERADAVRAFLRARWTPLVESPTGST
jgi:HD superfamily phosphohydrolase